MAEQRDGHEHQRYLSEKVRRRKTCEIHTAEERHSNRRRDGNVPRAELDGKRESIPAIPRDQRRGHPSGPHRAHHEHGRHGTVVHNPLANARGSSTMTSSKTTPMPKKAKR